MGSDPLLPTGEAQRVVLQIFSKKFLIHVKS